MRARETTLTRLGVDLSRAVGRAPHWDHGAVSRFLSGATTTREMAEAFALVLAIPGCVYIARSLAEALELQRVAHCFDDATPRGHRLST